MESECDTRQERRKTGDASAQVDGERWKAMGRGRTRNGKKLGRTKKKNRKMARRDDRDVRGEGDLFVDGKCGRDGIRAGAEGGGEFTKGV